jgi:hypothetical protein
MPHVEFTSCPGSSRECCVSSVDHGKRRLFGGCGHSSVEHAAHYFKNIVMVQHMHHIGGGARMGLFWVGDG